MSTFTRTNIRSSLITGKVPGGAYFNALVRTTLESPFSKLLHAVIPPSTALCDLTKYLLLFLIVFSYISTLPLEIIFVNTIFKYTFSTLTLPESVPPPLSFCVIIKRGNFLIYAFAYIISKDRRHCLCIINLQTIV